MSPDSVVFFDTLDQVFPASQPGFEGPLSDVSLKLMKEVQDINTSLDYHYRAMNMAANKMAELQKQADTFRDKAAEHKGKLLGLENRVRDLMGELAAELVDDLANHEATDPNPIVTLSPEDIGRQV